MVRGLFYQPQGGGRAARLLDGRGLAVFLQPISSFQRRERLVSISRKA